MLIDTHHARARSGGGAGKEGRGEGGERSLRRGVQRGERGGGGGKAGSG